MSARWSPPEGLARLADVRLPACLTDAPGAADADGLTRADIWLRDGRIAFDGPADAPAMACGGAMVLPAFVDCHTHLDKGHIWTRAPNPNGAFDGALETVAADRAANWSAEDVRARADFSIRCAYAHGTRAIRTHLDSIEDQTPISWGVFRELREEWRGRVELQAVSLSSADRIGTDDFDRVTAEVARSGGVLGAVTYPMPDLDAQLDAFLAIAAARDLHVDFHVDETQDPDSRTFRAIAEAKLRAGFTGDALCGHCCSLARQPEDEARETIALAAEARLDVVSLPMCNMYLQDRHAGRTPRSRGVTLAHEMKARGMRVAFASDNTRDPFYAYGDLDMLEVLRETVRIAHLDHPLGDWPAAFSEVPAAVMGIGGGRLDAGAPADFILFPARRWSELLSRPHADRLVIRDGVPITATAPDYAELDHLYETETL